MNHFLKMYETIRAKNIKSICLLCENEFETKSITVQYCSTCFKNKLKCETCQNYATALPKKRVAWCGKCKK